MSIRLKFYPGVELDIPVMRHDQIFTIIVREGARCVNGVNVEWEEK